MELHSPQDWKINYADIRRQISIADVLELIGWKPVKKHRRQLRGPCPIHRSGSGSVIFAVNIDRDIWYCHSKKCKSGGNQLDLYAAVTEQSTYRATVDLCHRLGIDPINNASSSPT